MKVALAGAGNISVVHAMACVATGGSVVAVASRGVERARERAEQTGARVVTIDELPAGADVVIVGTPPREHARIASHALDRGAVVLVESPLASTLDEADALVAADDGRLAYGANLALSPVVQRATQLTRSIGRLGFLEVRTLSPRPTDPAVLDPARGGGVLFELGPHPIALALVLAGDDRPVAVSATLSVGEGLRVDDHAVVTIAFESGLTARVEASWRSPSVVWDLQASSDTGVVRAELLPGVAIEHDGEPVALPPMRDDLDPRLAHLGFPEEHVMLAAATRGGAIPFGADFGRRVLEIICAAAESARLGAEVPLPFTGRRDLTPSELFDH